LALLGRLEQVDAAQEGALAGAAGAEDAHDFAFGDVEVDAFQHLELGEALVDPLQLDHRLSHQATWMWEPRVILPWLRAINLSTIRANGRMMMMKKKPVRIRAEALKDSARSSRLIKTDSAKAMTLTRVESFSREIISFSIGAGIRVTAWGTTTCRIACQWLIPSERAASICPPGTASIPAR